MTLPVLKLNGTAFEQGEHHGRELRDHIAHNLDVYFYRFEQEAGLSRDEVLNRARRYAPAIESQNSDYYAGMEGVAHGSGFTLSEIIALNVRYEIIYYQSVVNALATDRDGCTSFAVAPAVSANGHLLIGQNWDWIPQVLGAVLHTVEPDGLETLAFTEAGIVGGKIGLNSAGVGLVVNGLTSTDDEWSRLSKPFHVRCYEILREQQIETAVEVVTGTDRACSANYLIAQEPDMALNIEASPDVANCMVWKDGCLIHTNHFLEPTAMGITEPPYERRQSSCNRLARLNSLLRSRRPVVIEDIQKYLQDHDDAPLSICRHENPNDPVGDQYRTVTSAIMDLNERTLQLSDGPPCKNDYQTFALEIWQNVSKKL